MLFYYKSLSVGRRFLLKKKQMIFVFSQMLADELCEIRDKTIDLFIGKPLGQNISQFPVADKLEKKREGALVLFTVETKTDLMGIKTQTGISAFGADSPHDFPCSRAIEFTEENLLPDSEDGASVIDKNGE